MTDPSSALSPPASKRCWKKKIICFFFLLILMAGAAFTFCPWFIRMHSGGDINQTNQRVTELEERVQALTTRVTALSAPHAEGTAPATEGAPPPSAGNTDIVHLQNDLAALSTAFAALQTEVKQTGSSAAQTQHATQASLAAAIAFIQLRQAASSGQSFATELSAMREAGKSDAAFQEPLSKLDTIATKGAPTVAMLRDELITLESPAEQAIARNNAGSWWEKFVVELKGLVSIRKQHGGNDNGAFTVMESALAKNDIAAALSAMATLPSEAQQSLAEWRIKAEERQRTDDALSAITAHFTALANMDTQP